MPYVDRLRLVRLVDSALFACCREIGFIPEFTIDSFSPGGIADVNWPGSLLFVDEAVPVLSQRRVFTPLIENTELLSYFRAAWEELATPHRLLILRLLGAESESMDLELATRGLTDAGLDLKVAGFLEAEREYLNATRWLQRRKWCRGMLRWANVVLGSLGSVPIIGVAVDPLREWKESIEAQIETEVGRRRRRKG